MQIIGNIIILFILTFTVYSCTGGKYGTDKIFGPPEDLPFSRYEDMQVDVRFYHPDESYVNLGKTKGASNCGNIAYDYAYSQSLEKNDGWSYACCTHEGGSNCYRKIR